MPPCGWTKLGAGEDCAWPSIGSMANTGADGCAAPEAGIGMGGRPGLRFGDSGGCSAGTPGSELYIGSAANTGADGSAAPGPGTGAEGGEA